MQVHCGEQPQPVRARPGGRFRSDLYHRITVFTLELPPLRARKEDLDDLVPLFVAEYNAKAGKSVRIVPERCGRHCGRTTGPATCASCAMASSAACCSRTRIRSPRNGCSSPTARAYGNRAQDPRSSQLSILPLDGSMSLDDMEKQIVSAALERSDHNVTAAARLLGTSRETLRYRVNKYGLKSED